MRSRPAKILLTWFALALQVACASIPASGLLLCFGADGHFDVETPHEGRMCHSFGSESANPVACRDIAISGSPIAERPNPTVFAPLLPLLATAPLLPVAHRRPLSDLLSDSFSVEPRTREALRSVMLLL